IPSVKISANNVRRALVLFLAPVAIYGAHLFVSAAIQFRANTIHAIAEWKRTQLENLLAAEVEEMEIDIGMGKQGEPVFKAAKELSPEQLRRAVVYERIRADARSAEVESIGQFVGEIIISHNRNR